MKLKVCYIAVVISLLMNGCHSPGVAAYYRGNNAYRDADYTLSFANYLYAAQQGIVPAQYAVAYQYYYGLGTPPSFVETAKWLNRAAPNSMRAKYALAKMHNQTGTEPWAVGLRWKK